MTGHLDVDTDPEATGMPVLLAADEVDQLGCLLVGLARWLADSADVDHLALFGYFTVTGAVDPAAGTVALLEVVDTCLARLGRSWLR